MARRNFPDRPFRTIFEFHSDAILKDLLPAKYQRSKAKIYLSEPFYNACREALKYNAPPIYSLILSSGAHGNIRAKSEQGHAIVIDDQGNAYVTGTAHSNFPTVNAYDDTYNDNTDCFVFKLNSAGNGLVYSTYVGGGGSEEVKDIAIDPSGNVYVTGSTTSEDFPAWNSKEELTDAFVFKLNAAGDGLIYSTFIGGDTNDVGYSISNMVSQE